MTFNVSGYKIKIEALRADEEETEYNEGAVRALLGELTIMALDALERNERDGYEGSAAVCREFWQGFREAWHS